MYELLLKLPQTDEKPKKAKKRLELMGNTQSFIQKTALANVQKIRKNHFSILKGSLALKIKL